MAHSSLIMKNRNGITKEIPIGFSWTNLFFGFLVPILRSDWKWALIQFFLTGLTSGISWVVFPFLYNELYKKELEVQGYRVIGQENSIDNSNMTGKLVNKSNEAISNFSKIISPNPSNIKDLEALSNLYEKGHLTKEEFEIEKKKIIN